MTRRERRIRIEDVAAAAGVSIMSVSRAMRGVEGVSQATRSRILEEARSLGYRPSRVAGSLSSADSTLIGISVPTLFEAVFAEIFDAMREVFAHAGFETVIDTSEYDPAREAAWIDRMVGWAPAALVLTGVDHDPETRARLVASGLPVLEIWDVGGPAIDLNVGVDHLAAGRDMGRHLAALGYRRPAYVGVRSGRDPRAEKRREGMACAFADVGAAPLLVVRVGESASFRAGFDGAALALAAEPRPDVLCFLNDHMAFGGLMAVEAAGLDAPRDMGIVGFNGLNVNTVLPRAITTSVTPRRRMGALGGRQLVARIKGLSAEATTTLPVRLAPGATTRAQSRA